MSDTIPNFLDIQPEGNKVPSRCQVLPLPYEATVSYEGGTRNAPGAILQASTQVELYDRAIGSEGCLHYGIETLPAFAPDGQVGGQYVDSLSSFVEQMYDPERLIVGLGGEIGRAHV